MNEKAKEQQIIDNYQQEEKMMILVFTQWCKNNNLDPEALYNQAYPNQTGTNQALVEAINSTVSREESEMIPTETVLQVLQLFGNDELGFIVQQAAEEIKHKGQQ
ncbi:hypothetical protein [Virgibacillus salexigens]|uniref:Uncharacterized protein n=2 Tax=Virgibacillus TaxID=84406 RepID=A0A024QEQ9_9BACI|nr:MULTISPECIES: hypothetical protein [Virgibacillus]MYL43813.1 hypothetical protein [Virgibacillus massiliensis]GGJ66392.1 hypothetical protein GCM10007111_30500 [Virgibacillus kapii]CDQ40959.1 hypothetical protein BN990_03307 [Virgibacillus massiliensis]